MKGRFYAPFFYTEYTLDLTVKLARFLRRWQLGVACLDTSRLGYASPKTSHASVRTSLNRTMKARAEGEVAANPLSDLSPFSPPCVDFHFTPSLCRLHFRNSRECLCFLLRRYCGSVPLSKTVECCKTIFVLPWTFFQCSACRLLLFYIAFS